MRPPASDEDYLDTLIGRLARAEREANPLQSHEANWGGGPSVGGSPRNPDRTNSVLTPAQVLEICRGLTELPVSAS